MSFLRSGHSQMLEPLLEFWRTGCLLIALNSGVPGMCSIHANSAREAIVKLCTLPLLAGENVGHAFAHPRQHAQGTA